MVKPITHSFGSPNTLIPLTFLNWFAASWVASEIYLALCLNYFIPTWVKEYHPAALAKPDREPGKVEVP